jgi:hypothetical protein
MHLICLRPDDCQFLRPKRVVSCMIYSNKCCVCRVCQSISDIQNAAVCRTDKRWTEVHCPTVTMEYSSTLSVCSKRFWGLHKSLSISAVGSFLRDEQGRSVLSSSGYPN